MRQQPTQSEIETQLTTSSTKKLVAINILSIHVHGRGAAKSFGILSCTLYNHGMFTLMRNLKAYRV